MRDIAHRSRLEALLGEVAIAEQARIGRDLHDTVGQTLAALALSADRASRELTCRDGIGILKELAAGIRSALSGVRGAARGLTRVAQDAPGLVAAIEALAVTVEKHHGIACELDLETPAYLSEPVAEHLYRIASEAVANAVRHAQPTQVGIRLVPEDGRWTLEVRDDGIGLPAQPPKGGIGTWIMRSRAAAIDADLTIGNGSSGGTTVRCRLPGSRYATE